MTEESTTSSQRAIFNNLLASLGEAIGIPDLALDKNNQCIVSFEEGISINFFYETDSDTVVCFAPIAYFANADGKEALLARMLKANFFWQDTKGFTIAMEPETERLIIQDKQKPSYFADYDMLAAYIDNAMTLVQKWRTTLAANLETDEKDNTSGPEPPETSLGNFVIQV